MALQNSTCKLKARTEHTHSIRACQTHSGAQNVHKLVLRPAPHELIATSPAVIQVYKTSSLKRCKIQLSGAHRWFGAQSISKQIVQRSMREGNTSATLVLTYLVSSANLLIHSCGQGFRLCSQARAAHKENEGTSPYFRKLRDIEKYLVVSLRFGTPRDDCVLSLGAEGLASVMVPMVMALPLQD